VSWRFYLSELFGWRSVMSEEVCPDEFRLDFQALVLGVEVRAAHERGERITAELVLVVVVAVRELPLALT